jgi:hypothetical protein
MMIDRGEVTKMKMVMVRTYEFEVPFETQEEFLEWFNSDARIREENMSGAESFEDAVVRFSYIVDGGDFSTPPVVQREEYRMPNGDPRPWGQQLGHQILWTDEH